MHTNDIQNLLEQIPPKQLLEIFDLIPDILFWVKNAEGQLVMANTLFRENFNLGSDLDAQGLTDQDFSPTQIADQIVADDERVMSGEIIDELLEMNSLSSGEIGWFSTTKRPLHNKQGQCIGTYGLSWHLNQSAIDKKFMDQLRDPMNYIRRNYKDPITIRQIADHCNLSVSALERRFKNHLCKSPKKYLNEFRLLLGHRLLTHTSQSISEITSNIGLSDPAYFSRLYKKRYGECPTKSRK